MTASISPRVAETVHAAAPVAACRPRFFLVVLYVAVISFIADVADGQECASPFGTHSGADLKYCVLKAEHAGTDVPNENCGKLAQIVGQLFFTFKDAFGVCSVRE